MKLVANDLAQSAETYRLYKGCWMDSRPPHQSERLTPEVVKYLLNSGGVMLRNVYNFDKEEPTSFWFVIKDTFGGMDELDKKIRKYIKRANDKFNIGLVTKQRMLNEGYAVMQKAFEHYKTKIGMPSSVDFCHRLEAQCHDYDYWGCIDKETDKLEAFAICHNRGDMCEFETSKVNPMFLTHYYPMYGLYYARNAYYLGKKQMKYVISSQRSVTEHSNIQEFLIDKLKFRKAYCDMDIYYKWYLKLAVNLLYPFHHYIKSPRMVALLRQEAMARGEY